MSARPSEMRGSGRTQPVLTLFLGLVAVLVIAVLPASIPRSQSRPEPPRNPRSATSVSVRDFGATGNGRNDDRPAIQAALDAAYARQQPVVLPAGVFLLRSASQPGDRILRTYPQQQVLGAGRGRTLLLVAAQFGPYTAVIGARSDQVDIGSWRLSGVSIDQNAVAADETDPRRLIKHPRMAIRLGSYRPRSQVTVTDCEVRRSDGLNTFYLFAQDVAVSGCSFTEIGGSAGSVIHDHSTLYTASVVAGGLQTITANVFTGVPGSGGARSAIDTHGGRQVIKENRVRDYLHGMNITGMAAVSTGPVVVERNELREVTIGIELWVRRRAEAPDRVELSDVVVRNNLVVLADPANVRRDLPAETGIVLTNPLNDAPVVGLAVAGNTFLRATDKILTAASYAIGCDGSRSPGARGISITDNFFSGPVDQLYAPTCQSAGLAVSGNRVGR